MVMATSLAAAAALLIVFFGGLALAPKGRVGRVAGALVAALAAGLAWAAVTVFARSRGWVMTEEAQFHHLYVLGAVGLPVVGISVLAASVLRPVKDRRARWGGRAIAFAFVMPAFVAGYATHVEPEWLQVERIEVGEGGATGASRIAIAVVADIQTDEFGSYEDVVVDRVLDEQPDVIIVPGLFSHIEVSWEHEYSRRVNELIGRHVHTIAMDKRGMGLSDRTDRPPTMDERLADIAAVMDAAGLERASLVGVSEAAIICQRFAAEHPERVERLVLLNGAPGATLVRDAWSHEELVENATFFGRVFDTWGEDAPAMLERFAPAYLGDAAFVRWVARFQRLACTGHDVASHFADIANLDAYEQMPSIVAPTLVANCSADRIVPASVGDLMVERIPDAERLLFDGGDHFFWLGSDWLEVSLPVIEFLTQASVEAPSERRFATVVFTDIVGSTEATATEGDARWRQVLDRHDEQAWHLAGEHRGVIVKSTGDGLLARFDSPHDALGFATSFASQLADVDLQMRIGVHVGEIEIRQNQDITGIAVNLAARVEQAADDGTIFVSSTVRDMMLGGSTDFVDRGEHDLKGIDGRWRLYEVASTTG